LGGTVVALNGELPQKGAAPSSVFVDGEMEVERGRITYVGPRREGSRGGAPCRVIDAHGCAVIPGFVQAHVHLCQVLLRGLADDLPLLEWLKERIWPLEAAHDPSSLRASAELGLLEMSLCGTTTMLDMGTVHHHDAVFEAADASDLFVFSGKAMMDVGDDVPAGLRETTKQSLAESDALRARWNGSGGGRLHYAYAPRFILSCSEPMWRALAERLEGGAMVHSHVAEHPGEREAVHAQLGMTDLEAMRSYGIKGPRTILAHGVQLTPEEIRNVAADGTRIVHCPSANLKLGSGIAPVWDYWQAGVQLAMGADGAPCNNNLDPWMEMRHAALLAKVRTGTTTLPAEAALRLATLEGAKALGIGKETGSLEVGKRADFVVVRLDGPHVEPGGDVFSRLAYAATSRDVRHVFASGQVVVWNGESTRFDADKVVATARTQMKALLARAGL
jgi:5-methylthioadenosine/S-adenosylhomocysteine deaminase